MQKAESHSTKPNKATPHELLSNSEILIKGQEDYYKKLKAVVPKHKYDRVQATSDANENSMVNKLRGEKKSVEEIQDTIANQREDFIGLQPGGGGGMFHALTAGLTPSRIHM